MARNDEYPLPSHAVSMWTNGSELFVGVPPSTSDSRPHTLRIDLSRCSVESNEWGRPLARQTGWQVLLQLLKDRMLASASAAEEKRIGTRNSPVQYDIDAVLRAITRFDGKGKEVVDVSAEELGI